jgi:hypothetical protein
MPFFSIIIKKVNLILVMTKKHVFVLRTTCYNNVLRTGKFNNANKIELMQDVRIL